MSKIIYEEGITTLVKICSVNGKGLRQITEETHEESMPNQVT